MSQFNIQLVQSYKHKLSPSEVDQQLVQAMAMEISKHLYYKCKDGFTVEDEPDRLRTLYTFRLDTFTDQELSDYTESIRRGVKQELSDHLEEWM